MSDPGRPRRRIDPDAPRRRSTGAGDPWIITIVAAIVVVAGGWFLGQGLAHILGPRDRQAPPPPAATVAPVASPSATPAPTPSAVPSPAASSAPSVKPSAHPLRVLPKPRPSAPASTSAAPTASPSPTPVPTAAPRTPAPRTPAPLHTAPAVVRTPVPPPAKTAAPAKVAPPAGGAAEGVVRGYIDALRRGDPQAAAAYLGNGTPDEDFIDESTRIQTVSSEQNSDGSYRVRVLMHTVKGDYAETFVVAGSPGSEKILEKSAAKP